MIGAEEQACNTGFHVPEELVGVLLAGGKVCGIEKWRQSSVRFCVRSRIIKVAC
ncbi:unnamed protein product, partial [Scytosiphon promiscuus]